MFIKSLQSECDGEIKSIKQLSLSVKRAPPIWGVAFDFIQYDEGFDFFFCWFSVLVLFLGTF